MSIKSFHIVFIFLSIIISFWLTLWGLDQSLVISMASLLVGVVLIIYAFQVIRKHGKGHLDQFTKMKFDLIFCDPPFKDASINDLIELIIEKKLLKNNGIIILHRHKNTKEKLKFYFKVIDKRVYGLSKIIFGKPLSPLS